MKALAVALSVVVAGCASGATLSVDPDRLVKVLGSIDAQITEQANQVEKLSRDSSKPIFIVVNSAGGSVRAGLIFMDAIRLAKTRGTIVKCLSSVVAASMAFSIMTECSERYSTKSANFLFHPVWTQSRYINSIIAQRLAIELVKLDSDLLDYLQRQTGIKRSVLTEAFYAEKWWSATELQSVTKTGWLQITENIVGVEGLFDYTPTFPAKNQGFRIYN
jgi:ATP-dependent protease ClpP protease subunit